MMVILPLFFVMLSHLKGNSVKQSVPLVWGHDDSLVLFRSVHVEPLYDTGLIPSMSAAQRSSEPHEPTLNDDPAPDIGVAFNGMVLAYVP